MQWMGPVTGPLPLATVIANGTGSVTLPLGPQANAKTKTRDLQREGDILRWRILHYQHRFDHAAKDASLPLPVTGAAIADSNAAVEVLRQVEGCYHHTLAQIRLLGGGVGGGS